MEHWCTNITYKILSRKLGQEIKLSKNLDTDLTWGTLTETLRISEIVLAYSATEYAAPIWLKNTYTVLKWIYTQILICVLLQV